MSRLRVLAGGAVIGIVAILGTNVPGGFGAKSPSFGRFEKPANPLPTAVSPSAFTTIVSGGVLSKIYVGDNASFQVEHSSFPGIGQFYPAGSAAPAQFGVFLRDQGSNVLYGTPVTVFSPTPWSPVSLSPVTGSGTSVSPYTVTVVSDAGSCFRLTMTVTYVSTEEFFRHRLSITNLCGQNRCFDLYVGSDIFLASSDAGLPFQTGNSVGGLNCPAQDYRILHIPVSPPAGDNFVAGAYFDVWTEIQSGAPLSNTIQPATCPGIDDGAALQWRNLCLDPGATITIDAATSFGQIPTVDPVGACCVGGDCSVRTEADCQAAGGVYFGDGTTCDQYPCEGELMVCKFEDLNGNGERDGNESGIPGVTINALGPITLSSDVTGADGCVIFTNLFPGSYKVWEIVPPGMVQTAPPSVFSMLNVIAGHGVVAPEFGNRDTCATGLTTTSTMLVGQKDGFALPTEPSSPSPGLTASYTCTQGANDQFDVGLGNTQCLGQTFNWAMGPDCVVQRAILCFKIRGHEAPGGIISFYEDPVAGATPVWSLPVSDLDLSPPFVQLDIIDRCLNLATLPPGTGIGLTNVLASLQDGDFDVKIEGDSIAVDFLELTVTYCCPCVDPPDSMVAWWTFDQEDTLNFNDLAGSVNNWGAYIGPSPTLVSGCVANALSLNGNEFVSVSDQAELDFGGGNFSIDAWIRTTATGLAPIIDKRSGTGNPGDPLLGYDLFLFNGMLGFQMADGVGSGCSCGGGSQCDNYIAAGPNIADGLCHHVAVTVNRQGGTGVLYVDGAPVLNFTPRTGNIDNAGDLWIGRRQANPCGSSNLYWVGEIDEVELFNRALSAGEVLSLTNPGGKCKPCCDCPFQGDLNGDGFVDAVDLAILIDIVFFGAPDVQDPCCPTTRGDFNGDGFVDATDLAFLIDFVFFGGVGPINPCGP